MRRTVAKPARKFITPLVAMYDPAIAGVLPSISVKYVGPHWRIVLFWLLQATCANITAHTDAQLKTRQSTFVLLVCPESPLLLRWALSSLVVAVVLPKLAGAHEGGGLFAANDCQITAPES
jgi:hypothetical protein